jgi:uncharacterized spore protein YtfJ
MDAAELLAKVGENLSVGRAFGTAYERNGTVVIPVALVIGGGGGGGGTSPNSGEALTGSGGGFGGLVLPMGTYVIRDGDVRWVPAVDATLIVLAVLGAFRVLVRRTTRGHRRRRNGS